MGKVGEFRDVVLVEEFERLFPGLVQIGAETTRQLIAPQDVLGAPPLRFGRVPVFQGFQDFFGGDGQGSEMAARRVGDGIGHGRGRGNQTRLADARGPERAVRVGVFDRPTPITPISPLS